MKKENRIITFFKRVVSFFVKNDVEAEKRRSDEMKREMCRRAIKSNVCPKTCETCAWNVRED